MRHRYRTFVPLFYLRKGHSMDEQDNDQFDKPKIRGEESGDQTSSSPLSSRSIGPLGLASAGNMITQPTNGAGNSAVISGQPSAIGSRSNVFTIIRPAAPAQDFAIRRVRINRILMRKRRLQRLDLKQNATSRVLVTCLIVALVMMFLFSSSVGAAYAYYQSQLPLLNGIATHTLFQTTHIYDRNGHLLYELNDPKYGRRIYVNYNDIAPVLLNATVAAEDHTFWTNAGIDLQGILRAAFANLQQQTVVEGASTITQQLIKRELFSDQPRTLQIKAEEAILAYGLTQQYPKWKIIEMYLNAVYYGDLNYGVEAAAENYFGLQAHCTHSTCKTAASQLDLAQASMLAGLPQSPTYLNPIANKPAALDRQNRHTTRWQITSLSLSRMVSRHRISFTTSSTRCWYRCLEHKTCWTAATTSIRRWTWVWSRRLSGSPTTRSITMSMAAAR